MQTTATAEELIARAERAYFVAARKLDQRSDQPSRTDSSLQKYKGKQYIVLRNVRGVVAVYRVRTDGILKRLVRWPEQIEQVK